MKMRNIIVATTFLCLTVLTACSSDAPKESEVLISLVDSIIIPRYEETASRAKEMHTAIQTLCNNPSQTTLTDVRVAWRVTREPWKQSEAFWFGPVMDRHSTSLIDWAPVEPERIEAMLKNNPATDDDTVRNTLSATQRGMGAIEYLIFKPTALEELSDASSPRCMFLVANAKVVADEAEAVTQEWTTGINGGRAYNGFFTGRASSSLIESEAIADIIRTQVFLIRTIVEMQLGTALGMREGGADLTAIPGGAGNNSLNDLRNQIISMRDMYIGDASNEGLGISDLIQPLSQDADQRMRDHFTDSLAAIDAIQGDLQSAITQNRDQVMLAYESIFEMRRTLNTEVVSLLDVSVGFSDTDGDSRR